MLFPNLGAEEGEDWQPFRKEARVRLAARLWCLLYGADMRLRITETSNQNAAGFETCQDLWPESLGPTPDKAVFEWLDTPGRATAWLNTESIEQQVWDLTGEHLSGPSSECVRRVHDKAFAIESARDLGLLSRDLDSCIQVIDADSLAEPDTLIRLLDAKLAEWPDWTQREFTLKPRSGGSGRGRVAGRRTLDHASIRGAFPRLAKRGGAILEPWLSRRADLSVSLFVPPPENPDLATTVLGSLEMLVTAGGVVRGHCGEVDSRGRIFSGHPKDETLRADAAGVANQARQAGFFGPCGVDAFTFTETRRDPQSGQRNSIHTERSSDGDAAADRERLRSVVEFNARMTMGLVAIGLVRRALPKIRKALDLMPGGRRGFLLTFVNEKAGAHAADVSHENTHPEIEALVRAGGPGAFAIDLAVARKDDALRPILVVARERESLRDAHLETFGI